MLEGSSMVYLIDTETADSLRYASYSSLRSDNLCSMDWDTVDRLDITLDGTTYTISFDVTETEEDGEAVTDTLYTWDGQELNSSDVESLLSAVNSLAATGDASASGGETQLVSFTFHRNTDTYQTLTLTFYQYDSANCLVEFNGETRLLADRKEHLVFILWGAYAQRKGAFIDRSKHLVLTSAHPSPLSAYNGFFGNRHFSKTNEYLKAHGMTEIVW